MSNKIVIVNDYAVIYTRKNQEILIDIEDIDKIKNFTWHINSNGYVKSGKSLYLHRYLLNLTEKEIQADHKNLNRLDNRKNNLRICNHKENQTNKNKINKKCNSKYKGLKLLDNGNWEVRIRNYNISITIGVFINEIAAANAYNYYSKILHDNFARLNDVEYLEDWFNYKAYRGYSKYNGVNWHKTKNKWIAKININNKIKHIGYYDNETDAAKAYNNKLIELYNKEYNIKYLNKYNIIEEEDLLFLKTNLKMISKIQQQKIS